MNRYNIEGVVGEGAYGVVLKCTRKDNGKLVAVKKFKATIDDSDTQSTTLREFQVLKRVKHSNIMRLLEAFKSRGRLYLVLEYCNGDALDLLKQQPEGKGLDLETTLRLIGGVLKGLAYLHGQGIIHRDIKLENILVGVNGEAKLGDFGFARPTSKDVPMTSYVATRWYRAPELLVGGSYTTAVDVWAVGCVAVELLSGQPLLPGQTETDQLLLIAKMCGGLCRAHALRLLTDCRYAGTRISCLSNSDECEENVLVVVRLFFRGIAETLHETEEKAKLNSFIQLISKMLNCDPSKRPSCLECLKFGVDNKLWSPEGIDELEGNTLSPQTPIYQQAGTKTATQSHQSSSGNIGIANNNNNNNNNTGGGMTQQVPQRQQLTGSPTPRQRSQAMRQSDVTTSSQILTGSITGIQEFGAGQNAGYNHNNSNTNNVCPSGNTNVGAGYNPSSRCGDRQRHRRTTRKPFTKASIFTQQQQQGSELAGDVFMTMRGCKVDVGGDGQGNRIGNLQSTTNLNTTDALIQQPPQGFSSTNMGGTQQTQQIGISSGCLTVNGSAAQNAELPKTRQNPTIKDRDKSQMKANDAISKRYMQITPPKQQMRQGRKPERENQEKRSSSYGMMLYRKHGSDLDSVLDIAQYSPRRRM